MIAGECDPLAPLAMMKALAGPSATSIAGAGHLLPMEQPEAMAAALKAWLGGGGA